MDNYRIVEQLSDLLRVDYDAARAYEQAVEKIDQNDIREQLSRFLNDHNRHVADISNRIRMLGGVPPSSDRMFKGYFVEGFASLRNARGSADVLEAMYANEKLMNARYAAAPLNGLPEEIRLLIENNAGDERRHLAYIESALMLVPAGV